MLGIAWTVSLLFSAPQASVFHAMTNNYCRAEFAPGWGAKVIFQKIPFFVASLHFFIIDFSVCLSLLNTVMQIDII
jgi:hypothetical protein